MNASRPVVTGTPMRRVALSTGVELDVELLGDPAAPPVFLLHGFPETHRTWRHQMLALALRYRVIAPDQRGFANSSRPRGVENYTIDQLAADVVALADALEIDGFTLVGHDWGGAVAITAALRHPDRVDRLVLVNAPHPQLFQRRLIDDPAQRRASAALRDWRTVAIDADLPDEEIEAFFDAFQAREPETRLAPSERAHFLAQMQLPGAMTSMLNWYRANRFIIPEVDEVVPRPAWIDGPFPLVPQPTLVLWGIHDSGLVPGLLEGLDQLIPDVSIVRLPAGHFPQWEVPEAVTRELIAWFNRTPVR